MSKINEMRLGFETAYIDGSVVSSSTYRPQFVSNNHKEGKKVLSSIEDELLSCDGFQISVAFITMSGITPLLQTLKELEKRNIKGEILTTNYLNFSEPRALKKLDELSNITLKMYDVEMAAEGFHTKGYIFKTDEIYRIIIGSSNITSAALTSNREWNTRLISTEQGEVAKEIVAEFNELWNSKYALSFDDFYENYKERYKIIKHQREIAKQEEITSIEKYKLQPNSMQVGFITNLKKILAAGEDRALLISATGTGKTYASAFAMRELRFKRVLFLVHRGQLARQTKKSYEKVFAKSVSMGLVGAGYHEYNADYVFATVQTLNRDEHLLQYAEDTFDCIILDEAHHVPAGTYQKIIANAMQSKYKNMVLDGIEYFEYSIMFPTNDLLAELDSRDIKYILEEDGDDNKYIPLNYGCIQERDFDYIKEQKIGYMDVARYTDGWYSCLPYIDVFTIFDKADIQRDYLNIIYEAMFAKCCNQTYIGEWHLLIGNIIKFLKKFEIDVDYFKLYYIFIEFLDISLIWHKSL